MSAQIEESPPAATHPVPSEDPRWYKDAVIYQVHVRAFQDSNDDGIGDFAGLTRRLDYIQDLGVNTIWLLPFYPSPGKDDGYDIADYGNVHRQYGTLADFRIFIREAHRRGLRVITELVVNHTSDQHPWFQAARRAPPGSVKRDYYVWSDDPGRYAGTRIIFTDTESSNWTWDPVAKAYFWHRFFSHQPDLNFENPHVERAVIRAMRYWLDLGVDGLRLDAVPYLIEREGTSNENLRETHEVVKRIRRVIDERYSGRMLLAEANQWPEDVRDYFADGDECHMAFHFPLMPRMYMAIAQEDRHPIVEIMEQTPDIPESCQWAIFLRNHDELTLEMVTSRERDYMYQMYAADPRARINLGIRRRLAPLMENDTERIKLMNSLLLSMPGSPIIYYGDEIGMGDNFLLGDRNGVRTPMQWSPDRNGGFSRADPQYLYLPPIMDPIYGYQAVNVEAQSRDRASLLNWMKRILQVRKSSQAFGRGSLRFIRPGNRKVLAYLREHGGDTILCVANLARSAQPVELNLADQRGAVPVEMLGRTAFPPIGELPYLLTLPGYGFYWFRLSRGAGAPGWHEERLPREDLPVLVLFDGWKSLLPEHVPPWRRALSLRMRAQLEERILPAFIAEQRWYASKGSRIVAARLLDQAQWHIQTGSWLFALFQVDSLAETVPYFVPLSLVFEGADEPRWIKAQAAAIFRVRQQASPGAVAEALADEQFCRALVEAIGAETELPTERGRIRFVRTTAFAELRGSADEELSATLPQAQGSNTAIRLGERLFLKAIRRLHTGASPEFEIGRFLTEVARFPHTVPVAGEVEYQGNDGTRYTLALLQAFVANQGDGWEYTLGYLGRFIEDQHNLELPPAETHGAYLALMRTLGHRTAELHRALAIPTVHADFGAAPITLADLARWRDALLAEARATLDLLAAPESLPEPVRPAAMELGARREALMARIVALTPAAAAGVRIRLHGDYHLGQVLLRRNDWVIVDFEGEPGRSPEERRSKHSPLRDVAGMLRSFVYARHVALRRCELHSAADCSRWEPALRDWEREARAAFLEAYEEAVRGSGLFGSFEDARPLLEFFEIEKNLYELRYELRSRPDWLGIPLGSLIGALKTRG